MEPEKWKNTRNQTIEERIQESKELFYKENIEINKLRFTRETKEREYNFDVADFTCEEVLVYGSFSRVDKFKYKPSNLSVAVRRIPLITLNMHIDMTMNEIKKHKFLLPDPHILDFYGVCMYQHDLLYFVELMDLSLRDTYKLFHSTIGYFPEQLLHYILVSVLNGLETCNKKNIIHCNLKPTKILMKYTGEVKLGDFRWSQKEDEENNRYGTPMYCPPELTVATKYGYILGTCMHFPKPNNLLITDSKICSNRFFGY